LAGQFVPVKLNAEKEGAALARKHQVSGFPTILFIDPSGKVRAGIEGYMPAKPFAAELRKIGQAHKVAK
jgi:thioredoxin-related protein